MARVGSYAISQAAYDHLLASEVMAEAPAERVVPVPPGFTECIAHLRETGTSNTSASTATEATLKSACQKKYEALRERVLNKLITNEWLIGAAKEFGIKISEAAVQKNIAKFKQRNFPTTKKLNAYLASTGQTLADLVFQTRVEFSSEGIRREIKREVGAFTPARLLDYYNEHKHQYVTPESRDLEIAHVKTKAEALKLKRELESGKTFAQVVKHLPLRQPIFSKEGLVLGLKSGAYNEPPLNKAIFTAPTNKLIGPVAVNGPVAIVEGFYIVEVKRVHQRRQRSFAEVRASMEKTLPEKLQQKALVAYIAAWRKQWTPRTSCAPGYVVRRCKEYRVTSSTPPEDAYTLN